MQGAARALWLLGAVLRTDALMECISLYALECVYVCEESEMMLGSIKLERGSVLGKRKVR